MIYLTSDHGGFQIKERIKNFLEKKEIKYIDMGPYEYNKTDDYSLYAQKMGEAVVAKGALGIGICTTGTGMTIALNKVDGVRAAENVTPEEAKLAREHNDANVIVFGANNFNEIHGFDILDAWLNAKFGGAERNIRRVSEIEQYEEQH